MPAAYTFEVTVYDDPLCLNMRKGGGINGIEGCRYYIDPITKKKVAYWPNDPTRHQLPEGITEPVTTRTKIKEKRNKKERHAANGRRNWINPIRWIRLNKFLE